MRDPHFSNQSINSTKQSDQIFVSNIRCLVYILKAWCSHGTDLGSCQSSERCGFARVFDLVEKSEDQVVVYDRRRGYSYIYIFVVI